MHHNIGQLIYNCPIFFANRFYTSFKLGELKMSAKEKMHEIATSINEKTKEYAPIVKEKILNTYQKTKDFSINVIIPKIKAGADHIKEKIEDWQKNKQAAKTEPKVNTMPNKTSNTTNSVPPTQHTQPHHMQTENKNHQDHL